MNRSALSATRHALRSSTRGWLALPLLWLIACSDANDGDESLVCDTPPADLCSGDQLVAYAPTGTVVGGACSYEAITRPCAGGCAEGACRAVDPSCDGVACDDPPAAECDGEIAVRYEAPGTCVDGACSWTPLRTDCRDSGQSCRGGSCVSISDPCDGIVCDAPPAATCADATTRRVSASPGSCTDGTCSYTSTDVACDEGEVCDSGACITETAAACTDVVCDEPPADTCDEAGERAAWDPIGECSVATGTCVYVLTIAPCEAGSTCEEGVCVPDATVDPCEDVTCDTPPAASCADDATRRVWDAAGVCDDGDCVYTFSDIACGPDASCDGGACVPDEPVDPCAGVTCATPNDGFCDVEGDARNFASTGTCEAVGGSAQCNYALVITACDEDPCVVQANPTGPDVASCQREDESTVIFTEIMARSRSGTGDPGEFIEIHNTTAAEVDLAGCTVKINDAVRLTFPAGAAIAPAAFVVLGNSTNEATNLGNNAAYAFTGALPNTGFSFALECDSTLIDDGTIPSGAANALGRSWQLRPAFFTATANDLAANWCSSATAPIYNDDDPDNVLRGTPGTMNNCGE
jgi:hypothetical protein